MTSVSLYTCTLHYYTLILYLIYGRHTMAISQKRFMEKRDSIGINKK